MKAFQALAALSQNYVIGRNQALPWHLPEDFRWFKRVTTEQTIVMGRKTFLSIGRPLPNRRTIVVSRTGFAYPGVRTVASLKEIDLENEPGQVYVCGGAELYGHALTECSGLFLTWVKRIVTGDTYFPPFETLFQAVEMIADNPDFRIIRYQRRDPQFAPRQLSSIETRADRNAST